MEHTRSPRLCHGPVGWALKGLSLGHLPPRDRYSSNPGGQPPTGGVTERHKQGVAVNGPHVGSGSAAQADRPHSRTRGGRPVGGNRGIVQ